VYDTAESDTSKIDVEKVPGNVLNPRGLEHSAGKGSEMIS